MWDDDRPSFEGVMRQLMDDMDDGGEVLPDVASQASLDTTEVRPSFNTFNTTEVGPSHSSQSTFNTTEVRPSFPEAAQAAQAAPMETASLPPSRPATPTEPDCFSTLLDSMSEGSEGGADSMADDLLDMWDAPPAPASQTPSDTFDSQLTQRDDPMAPHAPPAPAPQIASDTFGSQPSCSTLFEHYVDCMLMHPRRTAWCDTESFFDHAPRAYDDAFEAITGFISSDIVNTWAEFKIGITNDPWNRWYRRDCGYHFPLPRGFSKMYILYAATSGPLRVPASSGRR
jgi:hypothetical protein